MSGLVTTAAFIGFVISPYVVETVTAAQTRQSWSTMWTICGFMFLVSWLVYLPIRFEDQPKRQQSRENVIAHNINDEK